MSKRVSVVVPTTLRTRLSAAINSVVGQSISRGEIEIVIVVDRSREEVSREDLAPTSGADTLIFSGGLGAAGARNLGVEAASAPVVAFLDDDDQFLPEKLERQLSVIETGAADVVGSRVLQRLATRGGRHFEAIVPKRVYERGPMEDYLFRGRLPSVGRSSFFTSTIMITRSAAAATPWDSSLKRHQDWDWLIRLERSRCSIVQLPEALTVINTGSDGSISASSDWRTSVSWAREVGPTWARRTLVDFVVAQPLRYALQARDREGVSEILQYARSLRSLPSPGPVLIGAGGVLSRSVLERSMFAAARGGHVGGLES